MNNYFLSKDALFHNRIETMSLEQMYRFDILLRINHFLNCAITSKDRERASGECLSMQYTVFLQKVVSAFEGTINREAICKDVLIFDDFIRIADFSFDAIREIVSRPSTQLLKVDTKVMAGRNNGLGNRSMRWLSQRPGRTIEEKISPQNKILTRKSIFTTDTKENREMRYLYKVLYDAIAERIKNTKCFDCKVKEGCDYYNWVLRIKKMMALNNKIKNGELGEVKPVKQSYQNNKLMCDKNYKIVWDAVGMLSHVEDKIDADYNSNLAERLSMLIYWVNLGKMNTYPNVRIDDYVGALFDNGGNVWFGVHDEVTKECASNVYIMDDDNKIEKIMLLENRDGHVILRDGSNVLYDLDVNQYFVRIEKYLFEQCKQMYKQEKTTD